MMAENKAESVVTVVVVVIVREEDWSWKDCLKLKITKGFLTV